MAHSSSLRAMVSKVFQVKAKKFAWFILMALVANPGKALFSSHLSKDNQSERQTDDELQRETEFLTCLIKTGYKSLLSHPLIESFIILKWQRVRVFFWISLIFYATMVLLFSVYVYEVYVRRCPFNQYEYHRNLTESEEKLTKELAICSPISVVHQYGRNVSSTSQIYCELMDSLGLKIIWFLLIFISVIITLKEIFQMLQGYRAYFITIEHYMQWLLLVTILMTVWPTPMAEVCLEYWQYPSAATGIFVAWCLMMVRFGKFPALGIYIQMLVKVIQNFGLFISAYACLLIGFALAFCVIFPQVQSFSTFPRSMLKTFTMMVGELNYESLFYDENDGRSSQGNVTKLKLSYPITAHILFGSFVIFVTIIMMNLLIGLAVHDLMSLEKGAKLERLIRQTSSISGLESFLFSKSLLILLPNSVGSFLRKRALLVPSAYKWTFYFRPNDPRDTRLPKELIREALCLANSRQYSGKRLSLKKSKRNTTRIQSTTFRWETHFENMEKRIRENNRKDLESTMTQIRELLISPKYQTPK